MPKDTTIQKILLIGSGPIVIGQGCEFDYSGVQACKALKEEGYTVILVNSNPATIMTDPEFADRTYIEPITPAIVEKIMEREKPDALLPTLGGQTALNCAMDLFHNGALERHGVKMIGANAEAIRRGEDRQLFKDIMVEIGLDIPVSGTAHTMERAWVVAEEIGRYPLIIRPAYTLGGSGGGIAYNRDEFESIVRHGLDLSPTTEVLIEESLLGWKEFEMEVIRDRADNCVVICSIENFDPMGIHTGDSITVAPIQTLTDKEYQAMRDASFLIIRAIGVETGGSNIQFSVDPKTGRMIVIEMNPRVSRSSALASKATGFPIAKIAAKLAVGYTLDELQNDITRETPACFEPTIDYVVTKIPRFTFEKFPRADATLTTQMKSVGEAMAIGRTFKESFQKAIRSLEIGRFGFGADGKDKPIDPEELDRLLRVPTVDRIFAIQAAFSAGYTVDQVHNLSKIDPWFLHNLKEISDFGSRISDLNSLSSPNPQSAIRNPQSLLRRAKKLGYSDRQLATLTGESEATVRERRKSLGVIPTYRLVDTCAAEFEAYTPYFYSTYGDENEIRPSEKKKVMILGGGPNRIGQGIEFDYCCVHAAFALKEEGWETIMVNSNPETVSTDYDTSDKLFFEPLTLEDVLNIYEAEKCDAAIVQFGGQTPLNLAADLQANGCTIIGTQPASIEKAEDRKFFAAMLDKLGLQQTQGATATTEDEAVKIATEIGYPVLVRPSFVLGGRAMEIVYGEQDLRRYIANAIASEMNIRGSAPVPGASSGVPAGTTAEPSNGGEGVPPSTTANPAKPALSSSRPILIDRFLEDATEIDVDCITDGIDCVIGGVMEHIEQAGIHSGDSACVIPSFSLSSKILTEIKEATKSMAKELQVRGLMNVQFAVKDEQLYVIEVNPRASRTAPFVSKAIGVPLPKLAAKIMAGKTLKELGFLEEIIPPHFSVKEAVFPFIKFPGTDITLGPEMRSTGEVMGIDADFGLAYAKAQMSAQPALPESGNVFLSVRDSDKPAIVPVAKEFISLGFTIYATAGTATALNGAGVPTSPIYRLSEGRPNVLDMIKNGDLQFIINTPSGQQPRLDEIKIRSAATAARIATMTTVRGAQASVAAIRSLKEKQLEVKSLQEYHA